MDEKQYNEIASADFTLKMIGGLIFGGLAFIGGIICVIVAFAKSIPELSGAGIAITLVGAAVAGIDGYILYSRFKKPKNKEPEQTQENKDDGKNQ
jgi:hypothetical protein